MWYETMKANETYEEKIDRLRVYMNGLWEKDRRLWLASLPYATDVIFRGADF